MGLRYRLRYGLSVDRSEFAGHKGPAVVLAVHTSPKDHVLTGLALYPERPTFVLSEHFMTSPGMRRILKLVHPVTKKMFCPDTGAVIGIIRAVRSGRTVVLFPEGRLTWHGRSLPVTDGTAELVKRLGADVFILCSEGAGKTFPKWASEVRRGRILTTVKKLFSADELGSLSAGDVAARIDSAVKHDEERAMPGVRFRTADTAAGLDSILWRCPRCGGVHTLRCGGNRIVCEACGLEAVLDEYGYVSGTETAFGISTVGGWYDHCVSTLDTSSPVSAECSVSTTDENGYMVRDCGRGTLTVDSEKITFSGTVMGRDGGFVLNTRDVRAFPLTPGDHIDIYYNRRLFLFSPVPDPRDAVILAAYMDKLSEESGRNAQDGAGTRPAAGTGDEK